MSQQTLDHCEPQKIKTRMHSSRMHTRHSLTIVGGGCLPRGVSAQGVSAQGGGVCLGGCLPRGVSALGVSCDLSHHAFDVTCMLPPHQCSCLYGDPGACWDTTPTVNRMTDRCKNITLPQTSFAGGNKMVTNCGRVLPNVRAQSQSAFLCNCVCFPLDLSYDIRHVWKPVSV